MSGGHFNYIQHDIDNAAFEVAELKANLPGHSDPQTVKRYAEASVILEKAAKMLQRIDWYESGDDGEASFNERWVEDGIDDI